MENDVFICESRYLTKQKGMKKIKVVVVIVVIVVIVIIIVIVYSHGMYIVSINLFLYPGRHLVH